MSNNQKKKNNLMHSLDIAILAIWWPSYLLTPTPPPNRTQKGACYNMLYISS